ncbi:glycoside hydrolase family 88 protein [Flavobacterium subsaxonicum]|uniref:Glycoside hydrolase n=1 Tax=Flavobacterium subsaxonicum WB 4.1-42 = DSM 21790 TaxID=1121898 RepID=A0A0A2N2H8_9FLAO|nr:glycoside hydrolase family 88 protein [Flavobacterium subsaxonicum]KGO94635.1 glycoside hydrolase [Flavobacterium subsaxonicum WB 4.1-42 = DSM 21790]
MKKHLLSIFTLFALASCGQKEKQQEPEKENLDQKIEATLQTATEQYKYLGSITPKSRYPKTYHAQKDSLETSDSGWWCSGFYPGTLLYLDEANKNNVFKKQLEPVLDDLKREQFNKSTHDLGFMMYCSFGNAERLTPKKEYEEVLMNSAKSLITRYNDKAKCIKSWDSAPWNHASAEEMPVIIDNMMNLELLFWATKHSGDSTYYKIAVNHANTTMKNHFRTDFSSFHEVVYNINTGAVTKQITNQGAADDSSWARGQAWGLYGYVVMYRETKDAKYLNEAENIANYILNHPNLPKDMIPYWDFNAPGIPNALRDSSAAAIISSALFELSKYSGKPLASRLKNDAETILGNLLTPQYIAKPKTNGGFILMHGVGNMPNKTEVDTPLSYGDYYLVEAMLRHKNY